jgi:hypothetical protein
MDSVTHAVTGALQVNIIKVAEVNISNAIKDQSDSAAAEKSMQKQWTRKLAEAQKKLAQGEGAHPLTLLPFESPNIENLEPGRPKCTSHN